MMVIPCKTTYLQHNSHYVIHLKEVVCFKSFCKSYVLGKALYLYWWLVNMSVCQQCIVCYTRLWMWKALMVDYVKWLLVDSWFSYQNSSCCWRKAFIHKAAGLHQIWGKKWLTAPYISSKMFLCAWIQSNPSMPYSSMCKAIVKVDPAIKYRVESNQQNGTIPFPDTLVKPEADNTLSPTVYGKAMPHGSVPAMGQPS